MISLWTLLFLCKYPCNGNRLQVNSQRSGIDQPRKRNDDREDSGEGRER